jgi:hypothetical protein
LPLNSTACGKSPRQTLIPTVSFTKGKRESPRHREARRDNKFLRAFFSSWDSFRPRGRVAGRDLTVPYYPIPFLGRFGRRRPWSRPLWPTPWPTPTPGSSSTATSSRPTSSSPPTARRSSWTSALPSTRPRWEAARKALSPELRGTCRRSRPRAWPTHRRPHRRLQPGSGARDAHRPRAVTGHQPPGAVAAGARRRAAAPATARTRIPPELERVCLKALAKRQQDRYTTAADFAADLHRVALAAELTGPATPRPVPPPAAAAPVTPRRNGGPVRPSVAK